MTFVANLPSVSTTLAKLLAKFAAGVVDTGGKFVTSVVDTDGNLAAGVVDTGGKFVTGVINVLVVHFDLDLTPLPPHSNTVNIYS